MKRVATVIGTAGMLVAGLTAAVALGSGSGAKDGTVSTTTTSESTTTTAESAVPKVWLCHHTGSWKHPYHLIHVSGHAVAALRRHGDVDPGAGNTCPTAQPAGTTQHGKSGEGHGDSGQAGATHGNSGSQGKSTNGDDAAEGNDDSTTTTTNL
jgi:hypothetical protein